MKDCSGDGSAKQSLALSFLVVTTTPTLKTLRDSGIYPK
jgi:hypothetical protein